LKLAQKTKLVIESMGMGLVSSQTPRAGSAINEQSTIELNYEPPIYD
ncbi:MAG: hypothetical protein HQK51_12755, partial [Oligoflexia bacterium]|nr:hypothetical protein [Oligoflexia bacterium]